MNENVIKMARLIGRCNDTTCEDCLSQHDNKCAMIEYAEVLDKAGYRKQIDTVKEFAEKLIVEFNKYTNGDNPYCYLYEFEQQNEMFIEHLNKIAKQYGNEE